jgi:hypothetical protein
MRGRRCFHHLCFDEVREFPDEACGKSGRHCIDHNADHDHRGSRRYDLPPNSRRIAQTRV